MRIDGFTFPQAAKFSHKILKDRFKVKAVFNYNPAKFQKDTTLHRCPILLPFMCSLLGEDDVDLLSDVINSGEIYTRMVCHLYKIFIPRENLEFFSIKIHKCFETFWKVGSEHIIVKKSFIKTK